MAHQHTHKPDQKVTVEPNKVGFKAPCLGKKTDVARLRITNTLKEKMVFKMKLTNPDRFAVGPQHGFVESNTCVYVTIKPNKFDAKKLPVTEHFTVIIARAPPECSDPAEVWKKDSPHEAKETKRFVVQSVYCKDKTPVPPVIPDPLAPAEEEKPKTPTDAKKPVVEPGKKPAADAGKKPPPKKGAKKKKDEETEGDSSVEDVSSDDEE